MPCLPSAPLSLQSCPSFKNPFIHYLLSNASPISSEGASGSLLTAIQVHCRSSHSIIPYLGYLGTFAFPGWMIHLKRKGVVSYLSLYSQCLVYGRCLLNPYLKKYYPNKTNYTTVQTSPPQLGSTREFSPNTLRQPLCVMNNCSPMLLE